MTVARPVRLTKNTGKVLGTFLADPSRIWYGYELMTQLGLNSGQLYPVLARLEAAGWIEGHVEDIDPVAAGRPARRYYSTIPPYSLADGAVPTPPRGR